MVKLNDITITNKLVLLVLFCVMLPLWVFNTIFLVILNTGSRDNQRASMQNMLELSENRVEALLDQCVKIGYSKYNDKSLNTFLTTSYTSPEEYLRVLNSGFSVSLTKDSAYYQQIQDIRAYVDNPTMLDGYCGYIILTDPIREESWYKAVGQQQKNVAFCSYIQQEGFSGSSVFKVRLSMVMKLNYLPYNDTTEKYLKVDIVVDSLLPLNEADQKNNAYMFLVNEKNEILTSNYPAWDGNASRFHRMEDYALPKGYTDSAITNIANLPGYRMIRWEPVVGLSQVLTDNILYYIPILFLTILIPLLMIYMVARSIKVRTRKILKAMNELESENFEQLDFENDRDEIGDLAKGFNSASRKLKHLVQEVLTSQIAMERLEKEKLNVMFKALQSQIDPHFLFNAFELIRMRSVLKKETETAHAIQCLSKLLRRSLDWKNDVVSVENELQFIGNYVELQEYISEFPAALELWCDEEALAAKVPKLTILTLVENCFVHAFDKKQPDKQILLSVTRKGERIQISLQDNGRGMPPEQVEKIRRYANNEQTADGVGIGNVLARLHLFFQKDFSFECTSTEGEGTRVSLEIPQVE